MGRQSASAGTQPGGHTTGAVTARHHRIVVAGGGSAGITVAARLCRSLKDPDVAIVDPAETHDYQPMWTLVGGGVVPKEDTRRSEADLIPSGATWIRQAVAGFEPGDNRVVLADGSRLTYDYLVVAVGIKLEWEQVKGLDPSLLGRDGICSNYSYEGCEGTWRTLQAFQGGTALFTMPPPPIKCAGAPQKIMYLADDHFRARGVRDRSRIVYAAGTPGIFSVREYAATLTRVLERKGIETMFEQALTEVRPAEKQAVLRHVKSGEESVVAYDMIHVTPPQGPQDVVRDSPLADEAGWAKVDKATLQSPEFPNVFALGDASSLPTSKTGAAIRKQAPVLVHNLTRLLNGGSGKTFKAYDGYTSCPLVTGYGKLVLAEFDYDLRPTPSFPFDTNKERWSMYQLKRRGLPALYWRGMLKGRA